MTFQTKLKNLLTQIILSFWFVIVIIISAYTNTISYGEGLSIHDWLNWSSNIDNPLNYVAELLIAFIGLAFFIFTCLSVGLMVLRILKIRLDSVLANGFSAFIIGEVFYSIIFLTTITFSKISPILSLIILSVGLIIGLPLLKTFLMSISIPKIPKELSGLNKIIIYILACTIILSVLSSNARLSYDASLLYFSGPKLIALTGAPVYHYHKDPFIFSTLNIGILYTPLMQIFSDQSARMLSWANGVSIILIGLQIAREKGLSQRAQIFFVTLILTTTAITGFLGDGKIEISTTAVVLCAVYLMCKSIDAPNKNLFLIIGTLLGFAIISRPYNIFLLSVFSILFYAHSIYAQYKNKNLGKFIYSAIWALIPMLLLALFHLMQNWFWLGNPLAPLTYTERINPNTWHWQFNSNELILFRIFYPIIVTFVNSPQSLGTISPLFIGVLPFLFFKPADHKQVFIGLWQIIIPVIVTMILWIALFYTIMEIRYVFFLWVLLFLPTAKIIVQFEDYYKEQKSPVFNLFITLLLIAGGVRAIIAARNICAPIDQLGNAHCATTPEWFFFQPLNKIAPYGERILTLNAFHYYLRPDLFVCSARANEYLLLEKLAQEKSSDFWVEAYRIGFKYVIYEYNYAVFHTRFGELPSTDNTHPWLKVTIVANTKNDFGAVYQLTATNPPFAPQTNCARNLDQQWEVVYRATP